ncbi:hypothetical protein T01_12228 [Trichinella spiralis]|uniref:PiggyBac transposable element-derived protein domain-containing protein n=1 Tax=Trichinella spiralis TaxID=6334 RepID=A0A0V1BUL6_TRISP|nr:hypothetical protein T01_12228 [Trichinella spiralis]
MNVSCLPSTRFHGTRPLSGRMLHILIDTKRAEGRHKDDGHPAICGITPPKESSGRTSLKEGGIVTATVKLTSTVGDAKSEADTDSEDEFDYLFLVPEDLGDSEETDKGDAGAGQTACHDFWLCDVMDRKDGVQSVATIRSINYIKTIPIIRLRSYQVMPFNELKRRRRGATDFYRTNDNKVCVVKWFDNREISLYRIDHNSRKWHRRVFFRAIHVSLTNSWLKYKDDCLQNGIATRDVIDLMEFMLSVTEKEPGPSRPDSQSRPEHTTRSKQTAHWPEMSLTSPDGDVSHPSLTLAGTSWTSFATRRVITLVNVQIRTDLAMASLPESSSVITPSGTGFAGCFPPGSAPNRKPVGRKGILSLHQL